MPVSLELTQRPPPGPCPFRRDHSFGAKTLLCLQIAVFGVAITIALTDPSGWTFAAAVLAGAALIFATRLP